MAVQPLTRLAQGAALAALLCLAVAPAGAAPHEAVGSARLLAQAEAAKTGDHARFLQLLKRLREDETRLSPPQQWHLRYLTAWQDAFAGKLARARPELHDIIDRSGDQALATRASALLVNILSRGKHYEKAYALANKLIVALPGITDARARADAMHQIVEMLSFAGQYDQALKYARKLRSEDASARSRCKADAYAMTARSMAGKLSSGSARLGSAIEGCLSSRETVYANTLRLEKANLLRKEGHAGAAIALLKRIGPSIRDTAFQPHVAEYHADLARDYLVQGEDARARKAALTALAVSAHSGYTGPPQDAYDVLYQLDEKAGHDASALSHYRKYVSLKEAATDDAKARALAYQMVKQQVVAKKLRLKALTRKNRILNLRQALAHKKAETSRLYIALLLSVIVLIGLWLYRLKSSQMRFRRMARQDGLTGVFNRQYFIDESHRVLRRLRKAQADACLVLMDLDHFKSVNDSHGHIAGDEVLRRAVEISVGELRSSDLFGRVGGEEFGILMPGCSREHGVEIGNRIRRALANTPIALDRDVAVNVSASLGLASSDESGYTVNQLFADADAALYRAKRGGRNHLVAGTGETTASAAGPTIATDP